MGIVSIEMMVIILKKNGIFGMNISYIVSEVSSSIY